MDKISKRTWILIFVFVVVALIASLVIGNYNRKLEQIQRVEIQSDSTIPRSTGITPAKVGTAVDQAQAYTDLVVEYGGRRIQFDARCQAIPSKVTFKSGTKIMFDNRSGDARIITIGGIQYNFSGYGYKVLTLSSPDLPKNFLVSCGAAVNVGQILIQQ